MECNDCFLSSLSALKKRWAINKYKIQYIAWNILTIFQYTSIFGSSKSTVLCLASTLTSGQHPSDYDGDPIKGQEM